ncbi:hypothetical protein TSAR_016980 [Trichomalopsis sarcophagae]|uniref:Uncharacterized protein n=1 Tax=Trichomalopsis sarcophagae TaxID=543379 RepID=A0A232F899_9HYME|nr:hypothetical protein TSAR_016980 [Trichomalopsis sarcophagae]
MSRTGILPPTEAVPSL